MLELRHLRYFIAVAEELHYGRAAERLNIEQSPLSRAIKDLESEMGARLFDRTTRSTRMTWAGQLLLEDARRVFGILDAAKARAHAAASGFHGHLRVGVCDGVVQQFLVSVLLQCRQLEPSIHVQLLQMPFIEQVRALQNGSIDASFALGNDVPKDLTAIGVWANPLSVAMSPAHPLADVEQIALREIVQFPLILCDPEQGSGCYQQIDALLSTTKAELTLTDYANSLEVMLAMSSAGYGIGFALASQALVATHPDIIIKPLKGGYTLTTYLLVRAGERPEMLQRFIDRAQQTNVRTSNT